MNYPKFIASNQKDPSVYKELTKSAYNLHMIHQVIYDTTVKPVLNNQSQIDKPKVLKTNGSLMKVESIAKCSPWSILQYFWPALSDNWSWNPIFGVMFEWQL